MQVKAISACPNTDSATGTDAQSEAFTQLYAEYFRRVRAVVHRRIGDREMSQELTQETFARLWADLVAGKVDLSEVRTPLYWLVNRAKWTIAGHYRRTSAHAETTVHEETFSALLEHMIIEDPAAVVAARIGVGQLMLTLPFEPRRALALCLLEDMPVTDVARETGLTQREVKDHVAEGLRLLREQLGVCLEQDEAWATRAVALARRVPRRDTTRTPVAVHIRTGVCEAVASGTYPVGTVLPSFSTLARLFAPTGTERVNPSSVSKALGMLCRDGLLTRTPEGYVVTATTPHADHGPRKDSLPKDVLGRMADLIVSQCAPGAPLSPAALARELGCTPMSATRALRCLGDAGLVVWHHTPSGRARYSVAGLSYRATEPAVALVPAPRRSPENLTGTPVPA